MFPVPQQYHTSYLVWGFVLLTISIIGFISIIAIVYAFVHNKKLPNSWPATTGAIAGFTLLSAVFGFVLLVSINSPSYNAGIAHHYKVHDVRDTGQYVTKNNNTVAAFSMVDDHNPNLAYFCWFNEPSDHVMSLDHCDGAAPPIS